MDKDRARECHVDQPGPDKVERHLVGYSCCRCYRPQYGEIICRCLCEERTRVRGITRSVPLRPALVPEIQLAACTDFRMAGDDLLDERCAGTRHADDQNWCRIGIAKCGQTRDQL